MYVRALPFPLHICTSLIICDNSAKKMKITFFVLIRITFILKKKKNKIFYFCNVLQTNKCVDIEFICTHIITLFGLDRTIFLSIHKQRDQSNEGDDKNVNYAIYFNLIYNKNYISLVILIQIINMLRHSIYYLIYI